MLRSSDVLIIGAGPVGIFQSFYLGLLGIDAICVDEASEIGGQCMALYPEKLIYDIPSHRQIIASDLIDSLLNQAYRYRNESDFITNVKIENITPLEGEFLVDFANNGSYRFKKVVLATGSGSILPNEFEVLGADFIKNHIHYSVKHKHIFTGKKLAIFGGGDSAIDWVLNLAEITESITLIHRRDRFRAMESSLDEMTKKANVKVLLNSNPLEVKSSKSGIEIVLDSQNNSIVADEILVFWGLKYNNKLVKNLGLEIQKLRIAVNPSTMQTSQSGIYAVGDSCQYDGKMMLIMTGFSECAIVAHDVYRLIKGEKLRNFHSTSLVK